jgi:hypothetical protein
MPASFSPWAFPGVFPFCPWGIHLLSNNTHGTIATLVTAYLPVCPYKDRARFLKVFAKFRSKLITPVLCVNSTDLA